ncbi:hypothetical protein [Bradyrhizobium manausense]|nr:hypothetical protein [Bradyrhizobium manausense]
MTGGRPALRLVPSKHEQRLIRKVGAGGHKQLLQILSVFSKSQ